MEFQIRSNYQLGYVKMDFSTIGMIIGDRRTMCFFEGQGMTAVLVCIAFTTGACAFMFFVLPFMDAQAEKRKSSNGRD